MLLKTWSFSKKKNSTAQPSGISRDYTVYMKEDTSIENPVFILGTGITADVSYCQAFNNYYFVDDIVLISKDQVELHCSIDVLATHKTAIGNYTGFVERSAAAHSAYIIDSALSAGQNIVSETMATTDLFPADQTGCFIVRVVSPSNQSLTGIASFVMSYSDMEDLLDFITTENNFNDVLTDSVVKSFFNPFQYIISIMWFPISKNDIAGSTANLRIGWWDVGNFKMLSQSAFYYANKPVSLPTTYYSNDFRQVTKNFTQVSAYIPGMGIAEVDPAILRSGANAEVFIDYATGQMNVTLYDRGSQGGVTVNRDPFGSFSSQLGVPIQCGQLSGMGSAVAGSGGATGGTPLQNIVSDLGQSLVAATTDALSFAGGIVKGIANLPGVSQNVYGSCGNMAGLIAHPRMILYQRAYGCAEFPTTVYGRPLCSMRQISTLPGFIKMQAASVALAAPDTETEKVNAYLNSGFYYE